ncbi:hypothetical protein lerEdw1_005798 [Lerista edwardsae]|nr:hypothetical protein lerEdw1_005798 [Lerista edwardsae]
MTAKGMYKLDDGNCRAANCFPARSLLQPKYEEGAGHWQVARQTAEKTKIQLLLGTKASRIKWSGLPQPDATARHLHEKILDGVQLMKLHNVRSPSHLCSVDISNQNFSSAKEEDFEQFDSVAYINATENLLTLDVFRTFPGLRELELSLNGLRNLTVNAGDFLHLEVLDLSYNNLSPEDVQALGVLSHLKVLHLTANGLHSLPLDLAVPDCESSPRFPALEVLLLDDNHLSHPNVFVSLANLRSLKQLNLDKNGIKEVPYLHYGSNAHFSIHPLSAKSGIREGLRSRKSAGKRLRQNPSAGLDEQPDYVILPNSKDPDRSEIIFPSPDPVIPEYTPSPGIASHCETSASFNQEFVLPLPELRFLSLANNQIEHEEDLLAVALFPSLTELTFHGNPFTISRSGDPPLLSSFLQNKLGIKLVRKKISKLEKPRIFIPIKANRKVKSKLPKVRKRPLMVEAPLEATFWDLWTGAETAPDIRDLEEPEPLPPIRTFSVEDAGMEPPEEAEYKFTPISVVPSRSLDELLGIFPASQPSLDRLLSASVPGVQTSVEQLLFGVQSLPRRSLVAQSQLNLVASSGSLLSEQDLSQPLSQEEIVPEAGPPSGPGASEQDISEGGPPHGLSQTQLGPAPPPNSPLPDQVQEGFASTAELPAAEQEPSSPAQQDQLQPPPPPSLPSQEQDLPHPEPPTSSPPAEEQHLSGTDLPTGPVPEAQDQPEHLPAGPVLDEPEQPEHLPAGPVLDAPEQPEHLPAGPVSDAPEQLDHLPSGPVLDAQEQPECLAAGPVLEAQEQPEHLPAGPVLGAQEEPEQNNQNVYQLVLF